MQVEKACGSVGYVLPAAMPRALLVVSGGRTVTSTAQ